MRRKVMVTIALLALILVAVSPQAVTTVWGYRAVRLLHQLPARPEGIVVSAAGSTSEAFELRWIEQIAIESLAILAEELGFTPVQGVRIIVDTELPKQQIGGYYRLGTVVVAPPLESSLEEYRKVSPVLHELTHLAIDYLAHGNYPAWLTEGLALRMEAQHLGATWIDLAVERSWMPVSILDRALFGGNEKQLPAAYWQSYVMVEYLYALGGAESMRLLLADLGRGELFANALWRTYNLNLLDFSAQARDSLRTKQEATE